MNRGIGMRFPPQAVDESLPAELPAQGPPLLGEDLWHRSLAPVSGAATLALVMQQLVSGKTESAPRWTHPRRMYLLLPSHAGRGGRDSIGGEGVLHALQIFQAVIYAVLFSGIIP